MVKRLSSRGYGTYKPDKKLYSLFHGVETYKYVLYNKWAKEVVNNPNGLTAIKAKQENDPDLDKIEIPVIGINHNHRVPHQTKAIPKFIRAKKERSTVAVKPPNITPETGKRWGWRTAEEGKNIKMHKIPMLEDKKEEKSK